jgi:hypothetical protein
VLFRKPKHGRIIVYASAFLVFLILAIEEFKPMWGASSYFDIRVIIASGLGSLLSILTFELIYFRHKKKRRVPG